MQVTEIKHGKIFLFLFLFLFSVDGKLSPKCKSNYKLKLVNDNLRVIGNKKYSWRFYYQKNSSIPVDIIFHGKKRIKMVIEWDTSDKIARVAVDRVGLVFFARDEKEHIINVKYSVPRAGLFLKTTYSSPSIIIGGSNSGDLNNFNTFNGNHKTGYAPSPDQHIWDYDTGDCHTDYPYNYFTPD